MSRFRVTGGRELEGTIDVSGAKNAVLPVMAATLLTSDKVVLEDVPNLLDVSVMSDVLESLGGKIIKKGNKLTISVKEIESIETPYDLISKMRASIVIMGPMLARKGRVRISHPGGCAIGSRPINWHLKGLEALGAEIRMDHGFLDVSAQQLKGTKIYLDFPSVGATENIMMAASAAVGTTIIENSAQEPEIVELANFINEIGGKIRGAGTNVINIEGVKEFHGTTHTIIPDRIEAGTYILIAAACGGEVLVRNVIHAHLQPLLAKLNEAGIVYRAEDDAIRVIGKGNYNAVDVKTQVHPGFPTDLQAPFVALLSKAKGTAMVTENIFENRFMHVEELKRMGANIKIEGRSAIIKGEENLNAATVAASDLRAGASLILAGLIANGTTEIRNIYHIDRGYEKIVEKLNAIGADIVRISAPE
ncbi:MAG: UDP-N-acetylglucosamine 1-carboxyvinyltransferase [Eubacteriales bacterium]